MTERRRPRLPAQGSSGTVTLCGTLPLFGKSAIAALNIALNVAVLLL
jgi:hypothetical protein